MKMRKLMLLFAVILPMPLYAAPSALVEDVDAADAGVQMLDFLSPGQVVDLGAEGRLSLGYLHTCVQEHIKGGTVTIGAEQSEISGGEVSRSKTQCDGAGLSLAANQAVHSGAVAMRGHDTEAQAKLEVHDLSPLFLLPKAGKVVIKRLDQTGERHKFNIADQGAKPIPLDLAKQQVQLAAGGKYMISASGVAQIFTVAKDAATGQVGTLGRLVPF